MINNSNSMPDLASTRLAYSAPQLIVYGRLSELTASGSGVYIETATQRSTARQRP